MRRNFDYQNEPKVGIFWYSPVHDDLFGVNKIDAIDVVPNQEGQKTIRTLHRTVWQKQRNRYMAKGKIGNSMWEGSYKMVPRGRVWQDAESERFYVMVGSWIDKYPSAMDLIIDEFDLPDDTEFVKDTHWEIGHGWSE
jgi:peptidoglycan/xylan/chitin deacetylase (PgdA/CDA1 family)